MATIQQAGQELACAFSRTRLLPTDKPLDVDQDLASHSHTFLGTMVDSPDVLLVPCALPSIWSGSILHLLRLYGIRRPQLLTIDPSEFFRLPC